MAKPEVTRQFVGRINVVGDALVFGLALRPGDGQVVYLDMVGAKSSVEAVWARLLNARSGPAWMNVEGKNTLIPLPYSPGLKRYHAALEGIGQDNLVLVKEGQEDEKWLYLLSYGGVPSPAALVAAVKACCKAPLYRQWAESGELLEVARERKLAVPCVCLGGVELLAVSRLSSAWENAITESKRVGRLRLPIES
jgi:hypothetical protein